MNKMLQHAESLIHYGILRRSGRYPWGSGENPYQRSGDFLSRVNSLLDKGMTEAEIARSFGLTTTEFRAQKANAINQRRQDNVARAKSLRADGKNISEIAREMGVNESTVRSWFNSETEARRNSAKTVAEIIKQRIDEKGMVDVGKGVERYLGVSPEKLEQALAILEEQGYSVYGGRIEQLTNPGKHTTIKVICPPGTPHSEIYKTENINTIEDYTSDDGGKTFRKMQYPASMDSDRIAIRYAEEGGANMDGVIEIRRGVDDLSLGNSHYAQVRILVDGDRYMKGMAVYSDDLPDGVDVRFNTNKHAGTDMRDVLKKIETTDPNNPFGSLIKANGQSTYIGPDGKEHLSLINKRAEEGDWGSWDDKLPSQFLAKQDIGLIRKQLNLTIKDKQDLYNEILSLQNPVVKRTMLEDFAQECDSSAVYLKAIAMPRQKYQVILPVNSLKDNEVYAPNYKDGEEVALIRYPHGGTFEIPILKVNNKNPDAKNMIGPNPLDAVGINSSVAARLSGADFDGDTVMVIPNNGRNRITSTPALKTLEGFDPKESYGCHETVTDSKGNVHYYRNGIEYRPITKKNTMENEMGSITNLITDMTLKGAGPDELARAVRHSMVVIDAQKHNLDYRQSEIDNGIDALKRVYQQHDDDDGYGGASTLISRAKSQTRVNKRRGSPDINPKTGELEWTEDTTTYIDNKGVERRRQQVSTQMAETSNAFTLSSGTAQENAYAEYANALKRFANQARLEYLNTPRMAYSPKAKETYAAEYDRLMATLNVSEKNAPLERRAQFLASSRVQAMIDNDPSLRDSNNKGMLRKIKNQALVEARITVGAQRRPIRLDDRLWEAIQAGAVSDSRLTSIFKHVDTDQLWQYALPTSMTTLSPAKISRIERLKENGYTNQQIASAVGVSTSTVNKYLKEQKEGK